MSKKCLGAFLFWLDGSHQAWEPARAVLTSERDNNLQVFGSINQDEFFQVPHICKEGETMSSTSFHRRAGGKGANCSVAIAQAGQPVDFAGWIGQDGVHLKEDVLPGYGVGVEKLNVNPEDLATGRAIIQTSTETKDNCIVLYKGANFCSTSALPADLSSYSTVVCQNEIPLDFTLAALQAAKASGLTTVFNPSPMLTAAEMDTVTWQNVDWLVVNEDELLQLYVTLTGLTEHVSTHTALQELHAHALMCNTNIVATRGGQGLLAIASAMSQYAWDAEAPCGKLERPLVDTTGAGDCFTGYFAALLNKQAHPARHVDSMFRIAQQASACCVEKHGAMESVPKLQQVKQRIQSMGQHWPSWIE